MLSILPLNDVDELRREQAHEPGEEHQARSRVRRRGSSGDSRSLAVIGDPVLPLARDHLGRHAVTLLATSSARTARLVADDDRHLCAPYLGASHRA